MFKTSSVKKTEVNDENVQTIHRTTKLNPLKYQDTGITVKSVQDNNSSEKVEGTVYSNTPGHVMVETESSPCI